MGIYRCTTIPNCIHRKFGILEASYVRYIGVELQVLDPDLLLVREIVSIT